MTTKQVLQLDCREEENKKIIQKVLCQIKPLSKYSDEYEIPFEMIEKLLTVLSKKYNMRIRQFAPDVWSNKTDTIWSVQVISDVDLQTIGLVYGLSVYEAFAKTAVLMYSVKDKVGTR